MQSYNRTLAPGATSTIAVRGWYVRQIAGIDGLLIRFRGERVASSRGPASDFEEPTGEHFRFPLDIHQDLESLPFEFEDIEIENPSATATVAVEILAGRGKFGGGKQVAGIIEPSALNDQYSFQDTRNEGAGFFAQVQLLNPPASGKNLNVNCIQIIGLDGFEVEVGRIGDLGSGPASIPVAFNSASPASIARYGNFGPGGKSLTNPTTSFRRDALQTVNDGDTWIKFDQPFIVKPGELLLWEAGNATAHILGAALWYETI